MIVVCSTCQARFKVADDKIGPRGAKVRCSKCQTVFIVHRELGVMPAESEHPPAPPPAAPPAPSAGGFDLDLEGAPGSGVRPSGLVADPFGLPSQPHAPAADPFADPFQAQPAPARAPEQAAQDPFGAADPFAAASGGSFGAVDPFVAAVASPSPGLPTSAVTDLSDLLGSSATPPSPPPSAPPAPEPSGILDSGFDFDAGQEGKPPLEAASPPSPAPGPMGYGEADLALDERTPAPAPATAPTPGHGDFAGADPFGEPIGAPAPSPQAGHAGAEGGDFDAFGAEPEPAPPPARNPPPPLREHPFADSAPAEAPPPAAEASEPAVAPASGFRRTSRARAVAVNAISPVALLAVAVGMLAIWRGVRPGSGGLFRSAAVSSGEAEPFSASELRSAIYERPDAPPLVFVTGNAVSRAAGPVAALRVHVELVRRGVVLAKGEARAGALPTPEDLGAARDAAGLSAALERSAARAPASVKPGQSVPFLVAIADFPGDVAGAGLHVTFEPMAAAPAPPGPGPDAAPPEPSAPAVPPEGAKAP